MEIKKERTIILVSDISSWPNTYRIKLHEDIPNGY